MQDAKFLVHDLNGAFLSNIVQSHDTIGNALGLQDTHPTDFSGIVCVRSATRLSVNSCDVDHTQRVAGDHTTLVKREAILLLGFCLVHEALADRVALIDKSVRVVFDRVFLFLG